MDVPNSVTRSAAIAFDLNQPVFDRGNPAEGGARRDFTAPPAAPP